MQYLSSKDSNLFLGMFLNCPSPSSLPLKDELLELQGVEFKDVLVVPVEEDLLEELREEVEEAALVMEVVLLPGVAHRLLRQISHLEGKILKTARVKF